MKILKTLPQEQGFFEVYARMAGAIRLSGFAAQIVSGLTEIGGIFAAAYATLVVILPGLAVYMAAVIALLGTAVIEIGLRVLMPQSVDAVLYKRFTGLHLPMTIAVWLLCIVLLAASGILSFKNSKTIVATVTPEAAQETTAQADSVLNARSAELATAWQADSAAVAVQAAALAATTQAAYRGQISAKQTELGNIRQREKRTGQSFASQREGIRADVANLEAMQAQELAAIEATKAQELTAARQAWKGKQGEAEAAHLAAVSLITNANQAATDERAATVAGYGGGLAWFTLVALLLFAVSVVLERIHLKGSQIEEKAQIGEYDFRPSKLKEAFDAFSDRIDYMVRSRITAFANATPPAPLPADPAELYDPAALADVRVKLELEPQEDGEDQTIYLTPKRRQIGFSNRHTSGSPPNSRVNSHAIKGTPKTAGSTRHTPDVWKLQQRLKDYKKRVGSFEQKALALERKGQPVPKRILSAIENNKAWAEHYETEIKRALGQL